MQGFFSFRVFGVWFFLPTLQERKERMEKAAQRTGSSPSAWRFEGLQRGPGRPLRNQGVSDDRLRRALHARHDVADLPREPEGEQRT